jgi:hypothetical protein
MDWVKMRLASERYRRVYMIYWKAKAHLWSIGIGLLIAAALAIIFIYHGPLACYLLGLDPSLLSQLCIGVGAALIGLIAVVFTLSIFVIQQISDRSVPGILREYAADNFIRAIYAALSALAVGCLLGALLSSRHHPVLTFSVPILCAVLSLALLSALFVRVAYLSDPSSIVSHVWQSGMREIKRLKIVQDELVRLNPQLKNETDPFGMAADNVGAATIALYNKAPYLTKKLRSSLDHLHSLMRHFSVEQQYALLDEAGGATVYILQKYIELRGSSLAMANTMSAMVGLEAGWDPVIVASIETFAALMRIAVESADTQCAQVLVRLVGKLGQASVSCKPYNAPPGENPTTAFICAYLTPVAKQCVVKKNEDVILSLNEQLLPIAAALAVSRYESTSLWLIEEWSQLATLAILGQQQIAATDITGSLLKLLGVVIDRQVAYSHLVTRIRDTVMKLCELEVMLGAKGLSLGAPMSASPDTPLRITLSGVSLNSIEAIHSRLVNLIASNYCDEKHDAWDRCIHMLADLDDAFWMRLEKIGLASAPGKESVLFYLNNAAYSIAEQLLWLWRNMAQKNLPPVDLNAIADREERGKAAGRIHQRERFMEKLSELLHWHVIAFYSRCRTLQPATANASNLRDCYRSAVGVAIQALGLGMPELALDTAKMVGSSCIALLKQGGVAGIVENCRITSILTDLGLVALHEKSREVMVAVEEALKGFLAEAGRMTAEHPEWLKSWSSPVALVTERIREIATGTGGEAYSGLRYSVWRPSYSRQEAQEYLQILRELLNEFQPESGTTPG